MPSALVWPLRSRYANRARQSARPSLRRSRRLLVRAQGSGRHRRHLRRWLSSGRPPAPRSRHRGCATSQRQARPPRRRLLQLPHVPAGHRHGRLYPPPEHLAAGGRERRRRPRRKQRACRPSIKLVTLGTDLHGIRLESHTEASDFSSTSVSLLVPWQEDVVRAFSWRDRLQQPRRLRPRQPAARPLLCLAARRHLRRRSRPGL